MQDKKQNKKMMNLIKFWIIMEEIDFIQLFIITIQPQQLSIWYFFVKYEKTKNRFPNSAICVAK